MRTRTRFPAIVALTLTASLALAGCTQFDPGLSGTHDTLDRTLFSDTPLTVSPDRAIARLPAQAGDVVSVTQGRRAGQAGERSVLAGDATTRGENTLDLRVVEGENAGRPLDARALRRELARRFPDRRLSLVDKVTVNAYGPYGLAHDGRGCAFAWQTIALADRGTASFWTPQARRALSLRMRLCRKDLSADDAIAAFSRLRLAMSGLATATPPALAGVEALLDDTRAAARGLLPAAEPARAPKTTPTRRATPAKVANRATRETTGRRPAAALPAVPMPDTLDGPAADAPETREAQQGDDTTPTAPPARSTTPEGDAVLARSATAPDDPATTASLGPRPARVPLP
ncbi:cellulose biosynthesis protein BcsN [Stappia sp.]|uniref:cellulose biosynthesis protein BcsN n=1 Tax=Stappia sp. TaxID=1870903 RepID=UPI0032D97349